jgi:uncharacterized protein YbjT (DUF2867 family)
MKKVLLFGASGNLGKEIAKELKQQDYEFTVVVRNKNKADELSNITNQYLIADVTNQHSLTGLCKGFDIIISSLGKSVSLNDKSKPGFRDIDFLANANILQEAIKSGVVKFVYISAFHSEKYLHLEYFKTHHDFSEKLKQSEIDYSIIKPPAIFSAFVDLIQLAKKGHLMNIGKGDKRTNPIFEGDLAIVCVNSIMETNKIIEAGGKNIYTRKQLNEIIQHIVNPHKKIKHVPIGIINFFLPLMKLINKNTFDKFAFFIEVMQHDVIAAEIGEMKFEDYIKMKMHR